MFQEKRYFSVFLGAKNLFWRATSVRRGLTHGQCLSYRMGL